MGYPKVEKVSIPRIFVTPEFRDRIDKARAARSRLEDGEMRLADWMRLAFARQCNADERLP